MTNRRKYFSVSLASVTLILTFTASAFAQRNSDFPNVKIKNFGQMDERFYRGAQPKEADYKELAAIGIKTVIDLRDDPESYEKQDVEGLGMRYVNIPMSDKDYPKGEQVDQFLKLVANPDTGKFFVHCAGGRHRTGVMGAVYRFNKDHWNLDQAFAEMNQYEFGSGMGHGKQKSFVQDYWQQFQAKQANVATAASAGR